MIQAGKDQTRRLVAMAAERTPGLWLSTHTHWWWSCSLDSKSDIAIAGSLIRFRKLDDELGCHV